MGGVITPPIPDRRIMKIKIQTEKICSACIIQMVNEDLDYWSTRVRVGTVDKDDPIIHINNIEIVDPDKCHCHEG